MEKSQKIGIFDSGIGGITVLNEILVTQKIIHMEIKMIQKLLKFVKI